jgi:hypothetical protein
VSQRRFWTILALIVAVGFAWRVGYTVTTKADHDTCEQDGARQRLCGDAIYYSAQAETIADGGWFRDPFVEGREAADHPPLTALVAAPASLVRDGDMGQRLTMCVIGAATIALVGLLGRTASGRPIVGLVAAGLAVAYPNLWMNDALVMAESVTALLVSAALLLTYRFRDGPSVGRALALGTVCGLAVLARAEQGLLFVVIVAPVVLTTRSIPLRERSLHLGLAGALAFAVVLPWSAYNLTRFEEPVLLSSNDGLTLLGASCDPVWYGGATGSWRLDCALGVGLEGDQSEVSARQREAAFEYIGDHLGKLPSVVLIRIARTWSFYAPDQMVWYNTGEGRDRWASWAGFWMYLTMLPFAVGGTVALHRQGRMVWPLVGTTVIVTLTAALFYGIIRFRIPAEVALVVLAAAGVDALVRRLRRTPDPVPVAS